MISGKQQYLFQKMSQWIHTSVRLRHLEYIHIWYKITKIFSTVNYNSWIFLCFDSLLEYLIHCVSIDKAVFCVSKNCYGADRKRSGEKLWKKPDYCTFCHLVFSWRAHNHDSTTRQNDKQHKNLLLVGAKHCTWRHLVWCKIVHIV